MAEDVEKTNSGVKKKGEWKDIAEFAEEVEDAVKESASQESVEEFEDWRPKQEEAEKDMKQKTVEKALVKDNIESEGSKDLKEASEKAVEATKKAVKGEVPAEELKESSDKAARPFAERIVGVFRIIESLVYSHVILRGKRYYLDTEEISADMKSGSKSYELDVNANTEDSRQVLQEKFEDAE